MNHGGFPPHANMEVDKLPIQVSQKKYDVFLSFRGEDTRRTFTSHLHKALQQKGIETYIDERLVRGDEISQSLLDAIEDSTISVIIFSENYASSSWCLDELLHILHCRENKNQTVLPVFYQVDPSDVRKQGGSYADAFVKLEKRFKDKINNWRDALTAAANLSGYDSSNTRNDSELVESIVKDIMGKLNSTSSNDHLKGLVGIEMSIEDLKSMLFSNPSHARIVGIWGMGGLGKTTLANAVFQQFHPHFEGHFFLANVREEMQKQRDDDLKKLFFGALSKEKDLDSVNLQLVKERLCRKRLLIVLDDVDDSDQYDRLIGDWDWLNSESRVIITSRNQQVLHIIGVNKIYEPKQLNEKEGLHLFFLNAFKGNVAAESYTEMSKKFVNYAQGVPLALRVLGSHLYKKSEEEWKSALNKLKVVPNKKIIDVLKISFDGLDNKEKEVFLDIACFFQGEIKDHVEKILDDGGIFAYVIGVLVDKSLITISDDNKLRMHDLLQEMGWEIARGPRPKEFTNYSRLWNCDDIRHVLKNNTGTARIEGIFLDDLSYQEINLKPDVFTKMSCLRLLEILGSKFHLPRGGLDSFPDTLRYLHWDNWPLESLGTPPRDLVYLELYDSQLEKLWNEDQHDLRNLKYIYLDYSKKLTCLPDLSKANLKILNLKGCKNLVDLPQLKFQSVANKLTEKETDELYSCIDNHFCPYLIQFFGGRNPNFYLEDPMYDSWIEHSANFQSLNLQGCSNLKTLSEMSGSINYISLRETRIEELHPSIGSLTNLVFLNLRDCKYLKNLPRSICDLGSLEYLDMSGCLSIDKFPELPKNIRGLDLCKTSIEHVPSSSFECLPCLEILAMSHCKRLVSLLTSICKLKSLRKLSLLHCSQFKSFPEIKEPMENLVMLPTLDLSDCKNLESIPTSICKLKSLKTLRLSDCSELKTFPEILEPMENLEELDLSGTGIKDIPSSIENLVMLDALDMRFCKNLESIPTSIWKLKSLKTLNLSGCSELKTFPEISEPMENLEKLYLSGTGIKDIPSSIMNLVILETLHLDYCKNLESLPTSVYYMGKLKYLSVDECPLFCPPSVLSLLPALDPTGTTSCELKCGGYCAGKNQVFLLEYWHGNEFILHSTRLNSYRYKFCKHFTYCECSIFYAIYNIFMVTYFHSNILEGQKVSFYYSGNKIPRWFTYQSMGYLIDVSFPQLRHNTTFLGFALCIVVDFDQGFSNPEYLELDCECYLKTNNGGSLAYLWTLEKQYDAHSNDDSNLENHVFIWNLHRNDNYKYETGDLIEFYLGQSTDAFGKHRVKQCGICILYRQDTKELDFIEHVPGGDINFDANEPHPKRIKS